jgi:hypothetical protein
LPGSRPPRTRRRYREWTVKKVVFDIKPHLASADEDALHESAQHGNVVHGISA